MRVVPLACEKPACQPIAPIVAFKSDFDPIKYPFRIFCQSVSDRRSPDEQVQTVEPWTPPNLWNKVSPATANAILTDLDAGPFDGMLYSDHNRAEGREAHLVVQKHAPDLNDKQARDIVKTWIKSGLLYRANYRDKHIREERSGLRVNDTKRPT